MVIVFLRIEKLMSRQLLAQILAPVIGLFIVCIGNAFIASLTTLRLDAAGESATVIGVISASYFIGLTLGAVFNDRVILRIGHIRAYSGFVSLIAISMLLQGLIFNREVWFVLRLLNGWACIGVFLVVESWLLLSGDARNRGRLLALYMIALYGSGMLGQFALGSITQLGEMAPFMVAGLLASMSVLPVVMIPRMTPVVERAEPLSPRRVIRLTPTGVMGCFMSGVFIAAIYTLLPLYLQRIGMDVAQVGQAMGVVILGAMVLQYPVGRWSDTRDRQGILITLVAFCALLSALILLLPDRSPLLMALLFLLGGGAFAVYPVAVSHAADRAPAGALVPMIQSLLLINSLGCALSPLLIAQVMTWLGAAGLFWCFAVLNLGTMAFFLWRRRERPAPTPVAPFAAAAQMSPAGVELRVTDDLVQGARDHEVMENLSDALMGVAPATAQADLR